MADWTKSMQQTFEYYTVDPGTWKEVKKIDNVRSSSISWDSSKDTLGSASLNVSEQLDECYIRIYLAVTQNGIKERFSLGTFLIQSPTYSFNGKSKNVSVDAYTPLIELKEKSPAIGYTILKNVNIMDTVYDLVNENARGPVVKTSTDDKLYSDFVSETDDTWMTFLSDLISNTNYTFGLDELSRVIFMPEQDVASMQPRYTFTDDNSSILYPDISIDRDMYGIPNVVEVIYSGNNGTQYVRVVNDDPNSVISTVSRGREILYRDTSPSFSGTPTNAMVKSYAEQLLRNSSCLACTVSFSHGYCGTRIGDCVRLNYNRAGLVDTKAVITSQRIDCSTSCKVTETATFTKNLWEG